MSVIQVSHNVVRLVGVDVKTTGDTVILPIRSGKFFVLHYVQVRINTSVGFVSPATIKIWNGTQQAIVGRSVPLTSKQQLLYNDGSDSGGLALPMSTAILLTVTAGASATTCTLDFDIIGHVY